MYGSLFLLCDGIERYKLDIIRINSSFRDENKEKKNCKEKNCCISLSSELQVYYTLQFSKRSQFYMNILHSRCAWILQCIPLQFQFQCDRCIWPERPSTNSIFNQSLTFSEIRMRVVLTFRWLPGWYTVARVVSFHVHLRVLSSSRWKCCIWSLSKDTEQQDRWFESLKLRKSNSKQL